MFGNDLTDQQREIYEKNNKNDDDDDSSDTETCNSRFLQQTHCAINCFKHTNSHHMCAIRKSCITQFIQMVQRDSTAINSNRDETDRVHRHTYTDLQHLIFIAIL